jgi:hypothetical protein
MTYEKSLRTNRIKGFLLGVRYHFIKGVEFSLFFYVGPIEIKVSLFDMPF